MRVAAVVLVAIAALVLPTRAAPANAYVRIYGTTTGISYVDLGNPGPGAGDESIRGLRLSDRRGRTIGNGSIICISLGRALPGTSLCSGVYSLPKGKLVVSGTRRSPDYYVLPVTGGTGIFQRAAGVLIGDTVSRNPRKDRLVFNLDL
jgi:hypothetical protein